MDFPKSENPTFCFVNLYNIWTVIQNTDWVFRFLKLKNFKFK